MTKSLDDEINRLVGGRIGSALAPLRSAVPSGPQLIGSPMNCSVQVLPFVVICEQNGDTLRMLRNEVPQAVAGGGHYAGPLVSPESLGSFRFDWQKWPGCPHCGAHENAAHNAAGFWLCTGCGSFNCVGSDRQGRFRCRCGRIVTGPFSIQTHFDVSGSRIASVTSPPLPDRAARAPAASVSLPRPSVAAKLPPLPPRPPSVVNAPSIAAPSSSLRLPWKR